MFDIIKSFKKMFHKERKYERFHVNSGTFVVITPQSGTEWKVSIIDISMGGLAFVYNGTPEELKQEGILDLCKSMAVKNESELEASADNKHAYMDRCFSLKSKPKREAIKYRTVSDVEACDGFRRRSVEFMWMGKPSIDEVRSFIKNNGIVAVGK